MEDGLTDESKVPAGPAICASICDEDCDSKDPSNKDCECLDSMDEVLGPSKGILLKPHGFRSEQEAQILFEDVCLRCRPRSN